MNAVSSYFLLILFFSLTAYTKDIVLALQKSQMLICLLSAHYFCSSNAVFVLESGIQVSSSFGPTVRPHAHLHWPAVWLKMKFLVLGLAKKLWPQTAANKNPERFSLNVPGGPAPFTCPKVLEGATKSYVDRGSTWHSVLQLLEVFKKKHA